jgi:hypothetical protein
MTKKTRVIRYSRLGLIYLSSSLVILTLVASLWTFGKPKIVKNCQIEPNNCPSQQVIIATSVIGTVLATATAFLSWVYFTGIEVVAEDSKSDKEVLDELEQQAMADELIKIMRRFNDN